MGDGSIRTQFDDLFAVLKGAGRQVGVPELSSASGMPEKEILKWLHILERQGKVHIENRFSGVYATWLGAEHTKPMADKSAADANSATFSGGRNFDNELSIAREREDGAKEEFEKTKRLAPEPGAENVEPGAPQRHAVALAKADMMIADVGEQLENVENMISVLRAQRRLAKELKAKMAEKKAAKKADVKREETISISDENENPAAAEPQPDEAREQVESELPEDEKPPVIEIPISKKQEQLEIPEEKDAPEPIILESENKTAAPGDAPGENQVAPYGAVEEKAEAYPTQLNKAREKELKAAFSKIKPLPKMKGKKGTPQKWAGAGLIVPRKTSPKIKKPIPIHVPGVSLQFSERLARQVKKILTQNGEIDKLRQEKEKLLSEHYLPMQRKLESEIETISDRVLRMEKNIIGMQERASNLPNKVSAVEKLQLSSIKAHGQMRRAYDEAAAQIEEASRELSEGREKMETMVDQSRQEISAHRAKTAELEKTLLQIAQLETEASSRVLEARAALAEQAERLASAERHAEELQSLKSEITEGVSSIKREIGTTKAVLTNIEKQMEQMRQVELYAESIRNDYEQKMGELGDYIKHGNEDFETLRESVEANFVRRYLKELRELTDGYAFEFSQARKAEGSIDDRIADEKKKLEDLIDEGKKIAHLYELQSKEVQGAESFEQRGEKLAEIPELVQKRTKIESMIAQIVGKRTEYQPKVASSPIKTRTYVKPKSIKTKAKKKTKKAAPKKAKKKGRR